MKLILLSAGAMLILWGTDRHHRHDVNQADRIAQLEALAACRPTHPGQIAAISLRNGVTECAITDQVGGRRRVVERRVM